MKHILLSILFTLGLCSVSAQNLAVKSNLFYDAAQTANLGVETSLGKFTTLDVSANYNAWYTDKELNHKMRHWLVQPEFRYYFCERMNRHFIGVHALATEYNVAGDQWLLSMFKNASSLSSISEPDMRYQGNGYGAGLVYGYACMLAPRWNLEFAVGAGYIYFDYDQYGDSKCAPYIKSDTKDYWGLTKLGVSLVYIIK